MHEQQIEAHEAPCSGTSLRIALVDSFAFTRECLMGALLTAGYKFKVTIFDTATNLLVSGAHEFNVILCYCHEKTPSGVLGTITEIIMCKKELACVPIILLSDALMELAPQAVRLALNSGIRGFISTRNVEMKTLSEAIRFVVAGGVLAPVDLLLVEETRPAPLQEIEAPPPIGPLTTRQETVLSLLQQGKANKIIAYELGMSESTVKVHIRNIMRKTGATNRTQAVYKVQRLVTSPGLRATPRSSPPNGPGADRPASPPDRSEPSGNRPRQEATTQALRT